MSLNRIAAALGLSVTTVSRALAGYGEVAAKTRARVMAEAQRIGYDNMPIASYTDPPLTTIGQPLLAMAARLVPRAAYGPIGGNARERGAEESDNHRIVGGWHAKTQHIV